MKDKETTDEASGQPHSTVAADGDEGRARALVLMRAGGLAFAVFAEEVEATVAGLRPTPLPQAPPSVLGVVCVRGRVRTLLHPPALLDEDEAVEDGNVLTAAAHAPRFVVTLRGDEQLALAAEHVERVGAAPAADILTPRETGSVVRATIRHNGEDVLLLDPAALFDAATRKRERRRQRTI